METIAAGFDGRSGEAAAPRPDGGLRWDGSALELLDQTALPEREAWLRCETVDDVARAIRRLAVRGAPAIAAAAAYGLVLAIPPAERDARAATRAFEAAATALVETRPTAVTLAWAVDLGRDAFAGAIGGGAAAARQALRESADEILGHEERRDAALIEHVLPLLSAGERILTHCNTGRLATGAGGTAGGALEAAHRAGRLSRAWVTETRPLLQGARLTAWELGRAGVPHTLVTDSSVAAIMGQGLVDRVIVGADRVAANGDVANKIGTYGLAVLARRHGIPFHVAAPLPTFDARTATGADIALERRDPDEVRTFGGTATAPAQTDVLNLAFDVTPAELVSSIVTEAGVLEAPYGAAIEGVLEPVGVAS